ncbi:uncharacterized protein [Watersipora subatra]|uniref:uncharacterized protein n=1 Tax=Watersipora subatra TaxID=2589382 RepID=UPI00355B7738
MAHRPLDSDDEIDPGQTVSNLPVEVQEHAPSRYPGRKCHYNRSHKFKTIRQSGCMSSWKIKEFTLTRECICGKYLTSDWENHYSDQCKWKRITDQVTKKVYLIRKCVCKKPSGV